MTSPVFLAPQQLLLGSEPGGVVRLSGPEGRHAATVRRLRAGEAVDLVDGRGVRVRGVVAAVRSPDAIDVTVTAVEHEAPPRARIIVVQALLKGDALATAVEMLTEIGVDEIVPWSAQRCVAAWRGERAVKGANRLQATAAAAGKQSRRSWFPLIQPLADSRAVAALVAGAAQALVLHESAADRLAAVVPPRSGELVVVAGPEGGVAPEELQAFQDAGARAVRMGPSVLRAATAATAAGSVILARCGRWD